MPKRGAAKSRLGISGAGRRRPADEAAWGGNQHQDKDRKDDGVGPAHFEEMAAEALDEPDQNAADHRAGDAADAAEHGRRERPEAGRIADDEAGEVVI